MNKLSWETCGLVVTESGDHEPYLVLYRGKMRRVDDILARWRVSQQWWKSPVERDYYRVRLEGGIICELFRDRITGAWHLQRVHD
ncbi:MAG: hypothetical protein ACOC9B_01005 [Chloroflexota bacterium]